MMRKLTAILAVLVASQATAQERFLIDWDAVNEESLQHLSQLIQLDTTNPPGNETLAAEYVKGVVAEEGID